MVSCVKRRLEGDGEQQLCIISFWHLACGMHTLVINCVLVIKENCQRDHHIALVLPCSLCLWRLVFSTEICLIFSYEHVLFEFSGSVNTFQQVTHNLQMIFFLVMSENSLKSWWDLDCLNCMPRLSVKIDCTRQIKFPLHLHFLIASGFLLMAELSSPSTDIQQSLELQYHSKIHVYL